ncbi:altered inheritance of mitochondria protein 21 [Candidatus Bathyarchaeota archaeon]|nr:altered inheritance of mitochondria protein 21 [Candidatus Bathyarchaeota archaeon]
MATTMPKPPPAIPPRPSRSQDKGGNDAKAPPKIPPRPSRHLERKISEDRFAPSPLNEGFPKQPKTNRLAGDEVDKFSSEPHDLQERPGSSVAIPSLGEEGSEYAAVTDELQEPEDPEQTRTIGGDMKLHEPKPSLPVQSAKQRVAAIARIDSDRAASSFGIGKSPGDTSLTTSPRIKKSTTSFMSAEEGRDVDEEHGMPEIGQRVPMDRTTGDVQAPSAPSSPVAGKRGKHHGSRPTSRGSDYYGRHGHGHISNDRLEKEYYNKHPEELQKERTRPYHERQHDYAMSRNELNGIIRDTADRGSGLGKPA